MYRVLGLLTIATCLALDSSASVGCVPLGELVQQSDVVAIVHVERVDTNNVYVTGCTTCSNNNVRMLQQKEASIGIILQGLYDTQEQLDDSGDMSSSEFVQNLIDRFQYRVTSECRVKEVIRGELKTNKVTVVCYRVMQDRIPQEATLEVGSYVVYLKRNKDGTYGLANWYWGRESETEKHSVCLSVKQANVEMSARDYYRYIKNVFPTNAPPKVSGSR